MERIKKNEHQIIGNDREIKYLILLVLISATVFFFNLSEIDIFPDAFGVSPSDVIVYHTFDSNEVNQVNAGFYGHSADIFAIQNRINLQNQISSGINNQVGRIGTESVGNTFLDSGYILGNWINEEQWNFLVDNETQKYSINLWVNGQFSFFVDDAGEGGSMLSALGGAEKFGFDLWVDDSNRVNVDIFNSGQQVVNITGGILEDGFANPEEFNMITFVIDKSKHNEFDNVKIWVNASDQQVASSGSFVPLEYPNFIDEPLQIHDSNAVFHRTNYNLVPLSFLIDDLCIVKDYVFTQSDVDALYNNGTGTACANISPEDLGTTTIDVPVITQFDELGGGSFDPVTISNSFVIGHTNNESPTVSGFGNNVTKVRLYIEDSSLITTGTLQAVVISNITEGVTTKGDEIIEAVSDSIDFSNPQFQISNYFVTFNFSSNAIDFSNNDILIGINATGLNGPLILNSYLGNPNEFGSSVCVDLTNSSAIWDDCQNQYLLSNVALMFEINEDLTAYSTILLANKEIESLNFGGTQSSPDTDGDGIYNEVDTLPSTFSNEFSDIALGGTSSGTITTRGDQILTITEETNPSGVRISGDISGGLIPAVVNACVGTTLITISSGDEIVVTCGSVSIDAINGPVDITFIISGGIQGITSLTAGNSITFDQDTFSFVAPLTNTQTIIIDVQGTLITLDPGSTISLGLLKITKLTTGGDDTFDFTVTGSTSYNPSINTASGGTSTITKLIMDTFPQNNDDGTSDTVTIEVGQSGIMVQEIILNNEKISQLTIRHLDAQFVTDGTVTAKIWSGITDGGLFEDVVMEDSSDVYDFSTETRHSTSGGLYQIFNFTTLVALTGTYFVGIEWENLDGDMQLDDMTTSGDGGFVNNYRLDNQETSTGCLVVEGTIGETFSECSIIFEDVPELIGMDLAIQKEVDDITVSTGIQTSNLKGYYTFDSSEIVDLSILLNAGTLGHLADGNFLRDSDSADNLDVDTFDGDIASDTSAVGILGDAFEIQSTGGGGGVHELVRFGTTANEFDWDFLTSSSTNDVTMSFWLKADQCCNPNEPLPVLSSNGVSMILGLNNTNPYIIIQSLDEVDEYVHQFTTLTVDGDSNFHNVVYRIDKTGSPDTITVCVDGTSNCEGDGVTGFDFAEDGEIGGTDQSHQLTIGEKAHNLEAGIGFDFDTNTEFMIDDLCIWDTYIDDTDIDTIYNSGSGNSCATVTSGGGGGMGMDGPTPVDPGTYSIHETIPAGWNLTTATCDDGSSSFSIDTISGIVIGSGANIECTFENEVSSPDTDGDGIYNEVDTLPSTFSDEFSDIALGGTSSGTITTRGDQILTITEETNPAGVRIDADISGGLVPAIVDVCGGISIITLGLGDEIVVTCSSVTIEVINGTVDITFISTEGTQGTTSLPAGNSITFDQDLFSFVAPPTNTQTITIDVEGTPIMISPGDTNTSPPEVGTIIASQDPIQTGTLVTASAAFTDLGPLETHTAEWDWGDQTTTAGVVIENGLSGTGTGSHTYSTPGVYTVTLTVTDDTGDSGSSTFQFIVIYDPSGGFVTGGGWINSPEGAYVAEPLLVGKATFGFVSKYQQGANVPTGNTQFSFQVVDLKFKSTEYDWLVVAGSNAKFKGTGTINGLGNYGFQLFGFDADVNTNDSHLDDKFRIKIWDKNNGDVVVYDNELGQLEAAEPSTVIGGGSIVIHNP